MQLPGTKFLGIQTSLNYHLLCNQKHCVKHWSEEQQNDLREEEAVDMKAGKCSLWLCISVAGNRLSALAACAADWVRSFVAHIPTPGSKARKQRCSPKNPAQAALAVLCHPPLFSEQFSQVMYFWKILITLYYRFFSSSLFKSFR